MKPVMNSQYRKLCVSLIVLRHQYVLLFELGQKQNGPSEKHVAVGNNAHANCLVESEKHPTTSRNLHICVPVPPKRPHCTHFNQTFSQLVKGSGLSSLKPTIRTYAQKKKKTYTVHAAWVDNYIRNYFVLCSIEHDGSKICKKLDAKIKSE